MWRQKAPYFYEQILENKLLTSNYLIDNILVYANEISCGMSCGNWRLFSIYFCV